MKCSKYFGAKWHGFIKSESILAPKGASRFKTQNIRYDIMCTASSQTYLFVATTIVAKKHLSCFPITRKRTMEINLEH